MQLTILLDLLHRQGAAVPTQRTALYDNYVELLLAREANKHPATVRKYRQELLEIIPFLGWYLHAHTERSQINGRMSVAELKAAMGHYQRVYGNPESIVDELFVGAADRIWALTSKLDDTYEFEVLSLREYFAARFLYRNAGEGNRDFDRTEVLAELLRRPYWLNTVRFYGGNAEGADVYSLTAGIEHALADQPTSASIIAAWTLLTDGVFQRRPREARRVLTALCADPGPAALLPALHRRDIVALRQLPQPPDTDGPDPTWKRLTAHLLEHPEDPVSPARVQVLRELLSQSAAFAEWWAEQLHHLAGGPRQQAWLDLAATSEAAAGLHLDVPRLDLGDANAELLLSTGVVPAPGADLEARLVAAVLNGECAGVTSTRSFPAQLAVAFAPANFLPGSDGGFGDNDSVSERRRTEALAQLRKAQSPYAAIARQRRFKAGQRHSTFPWADTATALYEHAGRCWLASEIAIIGAATDHQLGYTRKPGSTAFGSTGHPCEMLAQTRNNAADAGWWRDQLGILNDDLSHAEWLLALTSVAAHCVRSELEAEVLSVRTDLSATRLRVVDRATQGIRSFADRSGVLPAAIDLLPQPMHLDSAPPPLLDVARARRWLQVDAAPLYR